MTSASQRVGDAQFEKIDVQTPSSTPPPSLHPENASCWLAPLERRLAIFPVLRCSTNWHCSSMGGAFSPSAQTCFMAHWFKYCTQFPLLQVVGKEMVGISTSISCQVPHSCFISVTNSTMKSTCAHLPYKASVIEGQEMHEAFKCTTL